MFTFTFSYYRLSERHLSSFQVPCMVLSMLVGVQNGSILQVGLRDCIWMTRQTTTSLAGKAGIWDDNIRIQNHLNKLKCSRKTMYNMELSRVQRRKTSSTKPSLRIRTRHKDNQEETWEYQVNDNH